MISSFYQTPEWRMGDNAQKKCAKLQAEKGYVIIPVYDFNDRDKATKAPILFWEKKLIVGPDILLLSIDSSFWEDIKAKSQPTWRRLKPKNYCIPSIEGHKKTPFPRWEHGFDYSLIKEYKHVQILTNIMTLIIVHEEKSPLDPMNDSLLKGEEKWLSITLNNILIYGDHRKDWPGGIKEPKRRGRKGEGGILWARNIMTEIDFINDDKNKIINKFNNEKEVKISIKMPKGSKKKINKIFQKKQRNLWD